MQGQGCKGTLCKESRIQNREARKELEKAQKETQLNISKEGAREAGGRNMFLEERALCRWGHIS